MAATLGALIAAAAVFAIGVSRRAGTGTPSLSLGQSPGPATGQAAPRFSLPRLGDDGPPVSLAARGTKPAVVTFFASWCTPCRTELPMIAGAARRDASRVAFIGIDSGDTAGGGGQLVHASHVTFPVGFDPSQQVARADYGLRGMPSTYFVTRDGHLAGSVLGPLSARALDAWIARISA